MGEVGPTPRSITDDEAAFFREHGWVKLDQLITSDAAAELLERIKTKMGESAEVTAHPKLNGGKNPGGRFHTYAPLSTDVVSGSVLDEHFYAFSHSTTMGQLGEKLIGEPVRFWADQAMVKTPVSFEGGSGETAWHVDIAGAAGTPFAEPNFQFLVWLALNEIPPERGSMRFVSSQDIDETVWQIARENTVADAIPLLEARGVLSPPVHLRPGDATVHSGATLHGALANSTDEPRWVYNTVMFPARCTWTGEVFWPNEGTEMKVGETFPDFRFPVLA